MDSPTHAQVYTELIGRQGNPWLSSSVDSSVEPKNKKAPPVTKVGPFNPRLPTCSPSHRAKHLSLRTLVQAHESRAQALLVDRNREESQQVPRRARHLELQSLVQFYEWRSQVGNVGRHPKESEVSQEADSPAKLPTNSQDESETSQRDVATYSLQNVEGEPVMAKARNAAFAEEKAEVEVLYGQVAKHQEMGKKLQALQPRIGGGGRSVSESIGPIRDNTREKQIVKRNVGGMIAHIDKMLDSGQDKAREEKIIRAGPSKVGISEYLACLKRVDRILEKLTTSKMRVQQQTIGDYNELLTEGVTMVQEVFGSLVSERVQPVEPLHYIVKQLPFPTIPEDRLAELRHIDQAISSPNARSLSFNQRDSPSLRIYADCRSTYLVSSLQSLSIASISTSKRKNAEEPYHQGTSAIGTYASAMEGMFQAEFQNISNIFSRDEWINALEATSRKALAEFAKTLRELNSHIKANIITDCFLAYEIVDIVTTVSLRLNQGTAELKLPFTDALKPIRDTAKASLPELLEDQRRRINSLQGLPTDGAAIPFTAETMTRLQTLTAYPKPLSSILASLGDGNWTSPNTSTNPPPPSTFDVGADGTTLLIHYILDTLDTHLTTLDARARTLHKPKANLGVLTYNTIAVIDRMIQTSDLAPLLSTYPTAQTKLDSWRKKASSTYMDAWKEPCSTLLDVVYTNRPANRPASGTSVPSAEIVKALSGKDKDAIKEKFKHFNASFEDCVRRHREMMPGMEREVRSALAREIGNMIEPLYARFFDRYEALDRGRGKYVKWDKGQLGGLLAGLG